MSDKPARKKFSIGDRVKLSPLGIEHLGGSSAKYGRYDKTMRGTVVGFCYAQFSVRILRDGLKIPDAYHIDFWRKA